MPPRVDVTCFETPITLAERTKQELSEKPPRKAKLASGWSEESFRALAHAIVCANRAYRLHKLYYEYGCGKDGYVTRYAWVVWCCPITGTPQYIVESNKLPWGGIAGYRAVWNFRAPTRNDKRYSTPTRETSK